MLNVQSSSKPAKFTQKSEIKHIWMYFKNTIRTYVPQQTDIGMGNPDFPKMCFCFHSRNPTIEQNFFYKMCKYHHLE